MTLLKKLKLLRGHYIEVGTHHRTIAYGLLGAVHEDYISIRAADYPTTFVHIPLGAICTVSEDTDLEKGETPDDNPE